MDEQDRSQSTVPRAQAPTLPGAHWSSLRWLLLLLGLTLGLRVCQVWNTEVISRDGLGYIRIAWELEHGRWQEVVRSSPHHPGYPLSILAASLPLRHLPCGDLAVTMQLSAQLASSLASLLLAAAMFFLGRELFDRRVGFWAALLFQCLPTSGRVMADGLSEPLFL